MFETKPFFSLESNDIELIYENATIHSLNIIGSELTLTLKQNIFKNSNQEFQFVLFDRNEKIFLCSLPIEIVSSNTCRVLLDDTISVLLADDYNYLSHIRLCFVSNNADSPFFFFIKNTNPIYRGEYICDVTHIPAKKDLFTILYYSNNGILSIKSISSKNFKRSPYIHIIERATGSISFSIEDGLCIELPPEIDWQGEIGLVFSYVSNNFSTEIQPRISGRISYIKTSGNCLIVSPEILIAFFNQCKENGIYDLIISVAYEEEIRFFAINEQDFQINEHFLFDVRKNYFKSYLNLSEGKILLPFLSNRGCSLEVTAKERMFINQFNNRLCNIVVDDNSINVSVQCRNIQGDYKGFLLLHQSGKTHFIASQPYEEEDSIYMEKIFLTNDFDSGISSYIINLYCIFEQNSNFYLVSIGVGNPAILNYLSKKNFVHGLYTETIPCVLSSHVFGFKYTADPCFLSFNKKNICSALTDYTLDEALDKLPSTKPSGNIYGYISKCGNGFIQISILSEEFDPESIILIYYSAKTKDIITQELTVDEWRTGEIHITLPDTDQFLLTKDSGIYRLFLLIKKEHYYYLRLKGYQKEQNAIDLHKNYDRRIYYYPSIRSFSRENFKYNILPYYALNGHMSLQIIRESMTYSGQFTNCFNNVSLKRHQLELEATCYKLTAGKYTGFLLKYRGRIEEDEISYFIPYTELLDSEDAIIMKASVDISTLHLKMIFWDIFCLFEIDEKKYLVRCFCADNKIAERYKQIFNKDQYVSNDTILFPYITKTNSIALEHRNYYPTYDSVRFREKERLAIFIYNRFKKFFDKKNIYLIYEKYCTAAQDNGYFFFLYCMENHVEKEINGHIYYVIDKKSQDYHNVAMYDDHVLDFASLKHMIYLLASKLFISTDTKEHAYVYRAKGSVLLPKILKKEYVFLQHGVIALKKIDHVYGKGKFGECKKFVVSSNYEKNIITKHFHYKPSDVIVTGLARWDVLEDKSMGQRKIIIVPTWRSWLDDVENETFVNSEYFKRYMELLHDDRLYNLLKKYHVTADFYLHIKFKDYISNFDSKDSGLIRPVVFGSQPLNELLMESSLLITDYSSVSWDIYYQKKPVLFYQFDLEDYLYAHGTYIDFETELFGDRTDNLDTLFSLLEEYMQTDFELKPKYAAIQKGYFKYIDNKNSSRIWNEIKKLSLGKEES